MLTFKKGLGELIFYFHIQFYNFVHLARNVSLLFVNEPCFVAI